MSGLELPIKESFLSIEVWQYICGILSAVIPVLLAVIYHLFYKWNQKFDDINDKIIKIETTTTILGSKENEQIKELKKLLEEILELNRKTTNIVEVWKDRMVYGETFATKRSSPDEHLTSRDSDKVSTILSELKRLTSEK